MLLFKPCFSRTKSSTFFIGVFLPIVMSPFRITFRLLGFLGGFVEEIGLGDISGLGDLGSNGFGGRGGRGGCGGCCGCTTSSN